MARRAIFCVAFLIAAVMVSAFLVVGFTIKQHDSVAHQQSVGFVEGNFVRELDQLQQTVKDYSWWTDSFEHLTNTFNEDWAHTNVGLYPYDLHGMNLSFVISPADQTLYAQIDGERVKEDAFSLFSPGLKTLVDIARAAPDQGPPVPSSGYLAIGDEFALVGASVVKPEEGPYPSADTTVLIVAKVLSQEMLAEIESQLPIKALEIVDGETFGHLPIKDPDGTQLASFTWRASEPGTAVAKSMMPIVLGFLALVAFFTILVLWFVRHTTGKIEANESRFRDVADASSDWIWETDRQLRLTYLSTDGADKVPEINKSWLGQPIGQLFRPIDVSKQWSWIEDDARRSSSFRNLLCECAAASGDGLRTVRLTGKPFLGRKRQFDGYRGTATDITREIEAQRHAEYLSTHDSLSGLANRDALHEQLNYAIAMMKEGHDQVAVLCLDLDRFKDVNDTLGHGVGDALLCQLSERLRLHTTKGDAIFRISGDEFAIIQLQQAQPESAERLCLNLLSEIATPFNIEGQDIFVTASIGIALVPTKGTTTNDVLQQADIALYDAKGHGGNTYRLYDQKMDRRRRERKSIENDLRRACERSEFELFYQPIISMKDRNAIIGAEALIRWRHPQHGLIEPVTFIGVAEDSGLILPLSEWVVWSACAQAAAWPHIRMAINVSPLQLKHNQMPNIVRRALDDTKLSPERLEIEITEGVLLKGSEVATTIIGQLKDLGVQLTIDDFGTGYSNLSYMRQFSFDKLKIDRSFLASSDEQQRKLVRAIIDLGHSLDMDVCGEGVEHKSQLDFLRHESCDQAQGFYIGRPCPPEKFLILYKERINHLNEKKYLTESARNAVQ